ncbi:CKLF-like MARVEL transmembrane domain-containing protein 8 [Notolabrus celidotus]|uniref:CKLF-like MARVEL transmembrane domain-containing protein 8 n=1 Tax=Notolabrus celidotus TaxID=1203425 RepID=UPI00148FF26D|nr:CKLF-like MARVEL transmembrane domain-containing protein 8 [Notolabrus celidotus]
MDRAAVVTGHRTPPPECNISTSTLAFDQHFTTTAKGTLLLAEIVFVHHRIQHVPWTTLSLCLNCSATALYLVTAVVDALSVNQAVRGRHNYNCWAASAFFAFLTTLCYAGSTYLSYRSWRATEQSPEET